MAAHRGEVCKKGRVCRCRKCCKSCVCYSSHPAAPGGGMQLPRLDDPPAPSSSGSVLGTILGGLGAVVVVIFKVLLAVAEMALAIWAVSSLMNWLGGRRDDR